MAFGDKTWQQAEQKFAISAGQWPLSLWLIIFKNKVITLTNHNSRKQSNEPIRAQSKYMSPVPSAGKRVRGKSRLVLVLLLIGRGSGARFFNQWQSVAMQNQSNCGITFDTQLKSALILKHKKLLSKLLRGAASSKSQKNNLKRSISDFPFVCALADLLSNKRCAIWQKDGKEAFDEHSFKFMFNFVFYSYSKTTLTGATMEHRLELGKFHVRNLLPNSIYKVRLLLWNTNRLKFMRKKSELLVGKKKAPLNSYSALILFIYW